MNSRRVCGPPGASLSRVRTYRWPRFGADGVLVPAWRAGAGVERPLRRPDGFRPV